MAFNTRNPIGSKDPRDLYDNATNLDNLVNGPLPFYPDRLGQQRISWEGMEQNFEDTQAGRQAQFQAFLASSNYEPPVSYAAGVTLERVTQTFIRNDVLYRIKDPADLPYTLTGDWNAEGANFTPIADGGLRQELNSSAKGVGLVFGAGRVVSSIADLKALDSTLLTTQAFVLGYNQPNDGGGGSYALDKSDTATADDGGSVIVGADGGRWKLQFGSMLHVAQFGVLGSAYGDIAPVLSKMAGILYARRGGGVVQLGAASYSQTTTASLYPEVVVRGVATDNSRIEFTASNLTAFASFRPTGYVPRLMFKPELHNFTINSSSGKSSNCTAVDLTNVRQHNISGVVFANFMRPIHFNKRGGSTFPGGEVFFGRVAQCHFASCGYSVTFGGAANRNTFELNTYTNCDHGYDFSQPNNYSETNVFINENIEGCKNWAEWPGGTIYSQTWIGLVIENPTSNGFSCTVKDPGRQVFLNLSLIPSGNAAALDFYKLNADWSDRFGTKASSDPDLYGTFISEELRISKGVRNYGMYGATSYGGTLAANSGTVLSITIPGVSPGDLIKCSADKDLQGCSLTGWCSATNTVNLRIHNQSAASVTLSGVTLKAVVERFVP